MQFSEEAERREPEGDGEDEELGFEDVQEQIQAFSRKGWSWRNAEKVLKRVLACKFWGIVDDVGKNGLHVAHVSTKSPELTSVEQNKNMIVFPTKKLSAID